ncbi:hypothetical protein KR054_004160, partial [Drosophila jambulina]
ARLQAMQTKILPYQPTPVVRQSPGQGPPEPENDRRLYVPSLSQSLTRRDIFTHFCAFGDLERVCVKNGVDSVNYAIVIFFRTASMHLAIAANPHSIKGHRLLCRKAAEKIPGKAIRPTKPLRTVWEENSVNRILAAKPSEKEPKKQSGKSDLDESQIILSFTPSKLGQLNNLNTNLISSKKLVAPQRGDQTFAYVVAASERTSRWSFSLARCYITLAEKEALKEGYPSAAKKLLEARAKKGQNASTKPIHFIKPTTPLNIQEHQNYPSSIPEPIPNRPRVPVLLPPSSLSMPILLSSQDDCVSISKPDSVPIPTPKRISFISNVNPVPNALPCLLNPEFLKPKLKDLKKICENSYFGPDFRYEHHCYTNVVAYEKTNLYVDLEPGEREKRKTIKEFMDEKYGVDI